jgi:hypothetical protein
MAVAGHGRIVGVTSGSGWRPADAGAYSCAKRAVASLTWQVGGAAPSGVSVNALSPIAATRMVLGALARQSAEGNESGRSSASGGVNLGLDAVPPPEHLGLVGAFRERAVRVVRGQIIFERRRLAWVRPPHLSRSRTAGAAQPWSPCRPGRLATAEAGSHQRRGNLRLRKVFDEAGPDGRSRPQLPDRSTSPRCVTCAATPLRSCGRVRRPGTSPRASSLWPTAAGSCRNPGRSTV